MLDTPHVTHTTAQEAAVIHLTIPRADIRHMMGPAIGEVISTVMAQGIGPVGPVFSHHFSMQPDTFDFEVGVPVSSPVSAAGRVKPGVLPGTKVVRTMLHGGYEGLPEGWGQFMAWIDKEGLAKASAFWEVYTKGPESDPDPATWRTELNQTLLC